MAGLQAADPIGERTTRKVAWRLLPLVAAMFLVNNLDRINVSFAALTMNEDLGLTTKQYSLGAGIFFFAYFAFEIPSNLIMVRVGARRWMTRIMISWGLVSAATAFITGLKSFLAVRLLLGAAEAGLVPGIVLYISYWFPVEWRGRAVAIFVLAQPMSLVVAGVLSNAILGMDGIGGLHGWQWMFLIEAVPSVLLGFVVLRYLTDVPAKATWLDPQEKAWLEARTERPQRHGHAGAELLALANRRVALLATIYITRTTAMYGITFFLPLIVKGMGVSNAMNGFVSALPFLAGAIGAYVIGRSSDRAGERHWHTFGTMVLAAGGLALAGVLGNTLWAVLAISIASAGLYAQPGTFWPIPGAILPVASAAAGIAAINATGNLGGFFGPYIVGWTQEATDSFTSGFYLLAGFAAVSGLLGLLLSRLGWERRGEAGAVPL